MLHVISLAHGGALSITIVVSDKELIVQVKREGPKAEHNSEDDLEWDHVDNYENSGPVAGRDLDQE